MFKAAPQVNYNQIDQDFKVNFCWVRKKNEDYIAQNYWGLCRDYLADAIYFKLKEDYKNSIYGFKIKTTFKIEPYLGILFPKEAALNTFVDNINELNNIEKLNNLTPTEIVFNENKIIVLKLDPFWQKHPSLISLYSFLIKCFAKNPKYFFEDLPSPECTYVLSVHDDRLLKLINNLHKLNFPEFSTLLNMEASMFHNTVGFVSTFKRNSTHPLNLELNKL